MKRTRLLAVLLSSVLLLGMFPTSVLANGAGENVHSADLSAVDDLGTWVDSNGISYTVLKNPTTMVSAVKNNMSGNFILGTDMDMNGAVYNFPMFGGNPFSGVFHGNGYSIHNFSVLSSVNANNGLLFHSLTASPRIQDLTVGAEGACISMTFEGGNAQSIGGIAGEMKNTTSSTRLSNVTVYCDMTYTGVRDNTIMIGGMIGKAAPCTITGCRFYGSVTFTASSAIEGKNTMVGGMVGRHNTAEGTLVIRDCENYADMDICYRTRGAYVRESVGGMVGSAEYPVLIEYCTNYGDLKSDQQSGGIVGGIKGGKNTTHEFVINRCANYGDLTATVGAGGIIGEVQSGGSANDSTYSVTLSKCANLGTVTVETDAEDLLTGGKCGAGGMIGVARFGYYTVTDCYSNGVITCPGVAGAHSGTACGIIGFLYVNSDAEQLSSIRNCYAVGELAVGKSTYQPGAVCIASSNSATNGYLAEIINCYWMLETNASVMAGACNMKLSATSEKNSEKSAEEFSNGSIAELLGESFTQEIGTDAYPVLKPPTEEELPDDDFLPGNLFAEGLLNGYYDNKGRFIADTTYKTRNQLPVTVGTVLTVGALHQDQPNFGHAFDDAKASVIALGAENLTKIADLGNGYGIYSYTVPEGVAYVSVTGLAKRSYLNLLTANKPFDADGYYDYFGISAMTGDETSPLWQKRALFAGDSISYGYSDTAINGVARAWGGRIAYDYDMEYVNVSVSGASLTNLSQNRVISQLTPYLGQQFDYIVLEGGVNDANSNYLNAPVGEMTDGKDGVFNAATYAGALEELFSTVKKSFPNAAIGFVITFKMPRVSNMSTPYGTYIEVTKAICEKWEIEYLNLYENDEINDQVLMTSSDSFLKDGVHPNASGYDRLSPYIAEFMETLVIPQSTPNTPDAPNQNEKPDTDSTADSKESTAESTEQTAAPTEESSDVDGATTQKGCFLTVGGCGATILCLILGTIAWLFMRNKNKLKA